MAFKIATPLLHVLFMAAQLWGTWNFVGLYRRQGVLLREQEKRRDEEGGALGSEVRSDVDVGEMGSVEGGRRVGGRR